MQVGVETVALLKVYMIYLIIPMFNNITGTGDTYKI